MGASHAKESVVEIPDGLSDVCVSVYNTLLEVRQARRRTGVKMPRAVVVSDLDKDYDDLAAMTILKELHRLGILKLAGYVANLVPAQDRARFARGALDSMGLHCVPVGVGTDGVSDLTLHEVHNYELRADFMAAEAIETDGLDLLTRLCQEAKACGESLTLVCLSSLKDVNMFARAQPTLFQQTISAILMQGGAVVESRNDLRPDINAANNRYDFPAAQEFMNFISKQTKASTLSFTKIAAFSTPVSVAVFQEMARTGQAVGRHLCRVQEQQDLQFYKDASDPATRIAPHRHTDWFLKNRTCWYELKGRSATPPSPDERPGILPYVTKIVLYDALPALAAAGQDVIEALGVLDAVVNERHIVVGVPGRPGVAHGGLRMSDALIALMQGSQLAVAQGLPPEPACVK